MTGWVCVRVFCRYGFLIGILIGYSDGILLGSVNGCELGASDGDFLGNDKWTWKRACPESPNVCELGSTGGFSWGEFN